MKLWRQVAWGRALGLLLLVWLVFLLMAIGLLKHDPDPQISQRLTQAFRDLQLLHKQRSEISQLLHDYSNSESSMKQEDKDELLKNFHDRVAQAGSLIQQSRENEILSGVKQKPSLEYEKLRRRVRMGVEELWFFINAQIKLAQKKTQSMSPEIATSLTRILEEGAEHKRMLMKDVVALGNVDGFADWRSEEATELSDLVQRRLIHLQNPPDCTKARKLLCVLNKGCGYGCQLHHAVYCLIVAYATERTMILRSKGWRYNRAGWEEVFKPVSDTCLDPSGSPISNWPASADAQVLVLPIIDSLSPRPNYLPPSIPRDLAPRLIRLHGDPILWWVAQFVKYLLRPQPKTEEMLHHATDKLNFKRPIVGMHIRRTDKVGSEAAFHSVDEYMAIVEEYYRELALTQAVPIKRVFLASDDHKVFKELKTKYPEYEVVGDPDVAKTAALATRYSDKALNGIIMDIYFLGLSDFLVCTFSSQVCRVAYEIMQTLQPDASSLFRSLDDIYYYGGQSTHRRIAVLPHRATGPEQLDLEVGDTIGVAGNHWDGFSKGRNLRTNQVGLYPSFKVEDMIEIVDLPTYPDVPLQRLSDDGT